MTPAKPGEPDWAENPMLLAEAVGLGSADLRRIEVRGVPIKQALYDFESQRSSSIPHRGGAETQRTAR